MVLRLPYLLKSWISSTSIACCIWVLETPPSCPYFAINRNTFFIRIASLVASMAMVSTKSLLSSCESGASMNPGLQTHSGAVPAKLMHRALSAHPPFSVAHSSMSEQLNAPSVLVQAQKVASPQSPLSPRHSSKKNASDTVAGFHKVCLPKPRGIIKFAGNLLRLMETIKQPFSRHEW